MKLPCGECVGLAHRACKDSARLGQALTLPLARLLPPLKMSIHCSIARLGTDLRRVPLCGGSDDTAACRSVPASFRTVYRIWPSLQLKPPEGRGESSRTVCTRLGEGVWWASGTPHIADSALFFLPRRARSSRFSNESLRQPTPHRAHADKEDRANVHADHAPRQRVWFGLVVSSSRPLQIFLVASPTNQLEVGMPGVWQGLKPTYAYRLPCEGEIYLLVYESTIHIRRLETLLHLHCHYTENHRDLSRQSPLCKAPSIAGSLQCLYVLDRNVSHSLASIWMQPSSRQLWHSIASSWIPAQSCTAKSFLTFCSLEESPRPTINHAALLRLAPNQPWISIMCV
ncbi:hypothetical protein FB451DRAFT_1252494 [Mycena latifolia]|nr:hypothetical protein FB451DRAFT_1252494 [Mycena latifolia]